MDTLPGRFITIVKKGEEIYGLFTRPKCAFRLSLERRKQKHNLTFEELSDFYEFLEIPLSRCSSFIPAHLRKYAPLEALKNSECRGLPVEFQSYLAPCLSEAAGSIIHQYIRHFWNLSLKSNRKLMAAVSRMAS